MRDIFLEKSCPKYDGETSPRRFFKKIKIGHISGSSFIQFVFIICPSQGLRKYIETKVLTTCFCFM